MNCPKCNTPNPQGALYCQMCYEILMHDASRQYRQAAHQLRRTRQKEAEQSSGPSFSKELAEAIQALPWKAGIRTLKDFFIQNRQGFLMGGGLIVAGVGLSIYCSPLTRLHLYGTRLEYRLPKQPTLRYLVGLHTDMQIWTERAAEIGLRVSSMQSDETGSVTMRLTSATRERQILAVNPQEWIALERIGETLHSQRIPVGHPSLAPGKVLLDRHGEVIRRIGTQSTRLGRSLLFMMPAWPQGTKRAGRRWEEPIQWVEPLGDWKIFWRGKLRWMVEDFESCNEASCIRLTYQADLTPAIWESPGWAQGLVRSVHYSGNNHGEALFSNRERRLLSNNYWEEGTLTVGLTDIERAPIENRVGSGRLRKHFPRHVPAKVPGDLSIRLKNRLEIQKI